MPRAAEPDGARERIATRWRDLDAYGHVDNAGYLTYLEELLDDWLAATITAPEGWATAA